MRLLGHAMLFALMACAKIVPPDGGPKDLEPPEVVAMVPPTETTNFSSGRVYIEFNEYVKLNDIYNQMVVSPPLKKRPQITLKGKTVTIQFAEELEQDVTYNLQFGEGIVDLNEGNPAKGLHYVFSTGDELDSLLMRGRSFDIISGEPLDGVKVMLYRSFADSMPLMSKPDYFSLSGTDGTFELDYLAPGAYRLFALKEENFNYLYDDFSESIGFKLDSLSPVSPSDSSLFLEIEMNTEPDTLQYLASYDVDSTGLIRAQLYKSANNTRSSYKLEPLDASLYVAHALEFEDSLFAWHEEPVTGQKLQWVFSTSNSSDTVEAEVLDYKTRVLRSRGRPPLGIRKEDSLRWSFDRPISKIDTSLIAFYRDSIPVVGDASAVRGSFDVVFDMDVKDGGNYVIDLLPGALESREGYRNDTLRWTFQAWDADYFGKVIVNVTRKVPDNTLLQLLTQGEVVRQKLISAAESVVFERLLPATYTLRVLYDENGNGKWDPSYYLKSQQAEKFDHIGGAVQVRSNWEMELEW